MLNELDALLSCDIEKAWQMEDIDLFLKKFFTEHLVSSTTLQSIFNFEKHSTLIDFYLKPKSTRLERTQQLIVNIDTRFYFNNNIQKIMILSQEYRTFIDQLIQDNKIITFDKLSNKNSKLINFDSITRNIKLPGFHVNVISNLFIHLTGKQQEHIGNIIINDYLQVFIYFLFRKIECLFVSL